MRFFLLSHLFKADTSWSIDIGLGNKSSNGEKRGKEILALINYYIGTNNIHYVDSVVEEKEKEEEEDDEDES